MTTPLLAELADILSDGGRLGMLYRNAHQATSTTPVPGTDAARRELAGHWEPVLQQLERAVGLVTSVMAGQAELPTHGSPAEGVLPCTWCGGRTAMRIYGRPGHYSCWMHNGCPVDPPAAPEPSPAEKPAAPATTEPKPQSAGEHADERAGKPSQPAARPDSAAPASPVSGRASYPRRAKDRAAQHFDVNPDDELAAWTKEIRQPEHFPEATDDECAEALAAWHQHVQVFGRPLRFTSWAGHTGVQLYQLLAAKHGAMVQPEALRSPLVRDITASRDGAGTHRSWRFVNPTAPLAVGDTVTELDITAQFLAAARSVDSGDGEPDTLDSVQPDWRPTMINRPGYVLLGSAPDLEPLRAAARYSLADLDTGWWLPMPVAKYLLKDRGIDLHITRAVVWPSGRYGRRLGVWAATVGEARLALTQAAEAEQPGAALALKVLKTLYAAFLGGLMRSDRMNRSGTLRHDWNDQVVATAGTNALRALDKADGEPIGGQKDAFWFRAAAGTADAAGPLRPAGLQYADLPDDPDHAQHYHKPGKWHVNRWGTATDRLVTAHQQGRAGLMQTEIIRIDAHRES